MGPFAAGDDLAAHHICPVEARQIHAPDLETVSDEQAQSSLSAASSRGDIQRTKYIVYQHVAKIILVGNIGLCQKHDVEYNKLYLPDGLRKHEAPVVIYVESPKV